MMEPENLRENWELLGDVFYETTEVYEMEWVDKVGKVCLCRHYNF